MAKNFPSEVFSWWRTRAPSANDTYGHPTTVFEED